MKSSPRAVVTEVDMMIGTAAVRGSSRSRRDSEKPESTSLIMRSVMTRSGVSAAMRSMACAGLLAVATRKPAFSRM